VFGLLATHAAEKDLMEIREYLLGTLCNPQAWESLRAEIADAYTVIRSTPAAFPLCSDLRLRQTGYRKCVLGGYLFIYRVDEAAGVVHILRYFHHLQDYSSKL